MGKVKNLEKKQKPSAEFDKNNPGSRVKSINDEKSKKKAKSNKSKVLPGSVENEVKPLLKEVKAEQKKEINKALKAKKSLKQTKVVAKPVDTTGVPDVLAANDVIEKAVKAAKSGIDKEKESATAKDLFDDELRYGLQVIAAKIPKTPPHTKKIKLEHSLYADNPEICFIIRDEKPKKKECDETIRKFDEMLKEAGVTNKMTILPLMKLKQDYGPNNMKLKLLNTYDIFLVESEIAEHTYTILGKHFIKKRKRPLQIDTSKKETIKYSIENSYKKVSFGVNPKSNISIFEVGTHSMDDAKFTANIASAIDQLKEKWPGGWKNILRLYLKPMKQSKVSIPIYYSKINPNDVEVPVEIGVKQTRLDKLAANLAKKTKKLKVDRVKKRLVKAGAVPKEQKPKEESATPAEPKDEQTKTVASDGKPAKKDKKRKNVNAETEVQTAVTEEAQVESAELPKKKKKKTSETEVPALVDVAIEAPAVESVNQPKKKKKKASVSEAAPVPVAATVESKKKKVSESEIPATEPVSVSPKVNKKQKKKQNVAVAVQPGSPGKNANKKKQKKFKGEAVNKTEPASPAAKKSPQAKKNNKNKTKGAKAAA